MCYCVKLVNVRTIALGHVFVRFTDWERMQCGRFLSGSFYPEVRYCIDVLYDLASLHAALSCWMRSFPPKPRIDVLCSTGNP